jgi:hypothetical protein
MRRGTMLTAFAIAAAMFIAAPPTWRAYAEMAGRPHSEWRKAPPGDMAEMVKNAKTAADHEALAAQYDKAAADAKEHAATHRQMAQSYKSNLGRGTGASAMPQHCANLSKSFEQEAAMYQKMAATEREEAKKAK